MPKKKLGSPQNRNVSIVSPSKSDAFKKQIDFSKTLETSRRLFETTSKKSISQQISNSPGSRSVVFSVAFRGISAFFTLRFFFQFPSTSSKAHHNDVSVSPELDPIQKIYRQKVDRYEKMMNQARFEFSAVFLVSSFYIHKQDFSSVFSRSGSDSPPLKKKVTRRYERRLVTREVPLSSISISAESEKKNGSDGEYFPRYPSKDMKKIKKSLSRPFKIVIFKKREIRKCFKKMKLVPKSKKSSKKTFFAPFTNLPTIFGSAKSPMKKKTYDFEQRSKKMTKDPLINEIKIIENELI